MGCLFLNEICRVELIILIENHPCGVEVFKTFSKNLLDVSGFLDESREIWSGILDCGQVFVQLEVSRVVFICAKTYCRRDVTVSVGGSS